jgi:hypothetical protein
MINACCYQNARKKAMTLTVKGGEVIVTRWKKKRHVGEKVCGTGMHLNTY